MELETWNAPPCDGPIPNHPRFGVLIYNGVDVADIRRVLADHGWAGAWTNGVFDFHSTSHEADAGALERIRALPAPEQDPVGGDGVGRWG